MLLGFDALGRYGLLQFPSSQSAALVAVRGVFAVTGWAATSRLTQPSASGQLTVADGAATLHAKQSTSLGAFTAAGVPPTFRNAASGGPASYLLDSSGGDLAIRHSPAGIDYAIAGSSSSFRMVSPAAPAGYVIVTSNASFTRNFEAWFPRPF